MDFFRNKKNVSLKLVVSLEGHFCSNLIRQKQLKKNQHHPLSFFYFIFFLAKNLLSEVPPQATVPTTCNDADLVTGTVAAHAKEYSPHS